MARIVSLISLLLSVGAMVVALMVYLQADAIAQAAVERREQEMVERLTPRFVEIYDDFDIDLPTDPAQAKTLEELIGPLLEILEAVGK